MNNRRNVGRVLLVSVALLGANVLVAQGPGGGGDGQQGGGQRQGGTQQGGGQRSGGGQGGGQSQGGGSSQRSQSQNQGGGSSQRPQGQYQGGGQGNGGNHSSGGRGGNQGGGRPAQWGQRPQNQPNYSFRANDRGYLRHYYGRNLGYVNMENRPRFSSGGFFPWAYINYITPVPQSVYGYLPPPPSGYDMGYYQGYVVVYDPVTYFIANVVDLMTQ